MQWMERQGKEVKDARDGGEDGMVFRIHRRCDKGDRGVRLQLVFCCRANAETGVLHLGNREG